MGEKGGKTARGQDDGLVYESPRNNGSPFYSWSTPLFEGSTWTWKGYHSTPEFPSQEEEGIFRRAICSTRVQPFHRPGKLVGSRRARCRQWRTDPSSSPTLLKTTPLAPKYPAGDTAYRGLINEPKSSWLILWNRRGEYRIEEFFEYSSSSYVLSLSFSMNRVLLVDKYVSEYRERERIISISVDNIAIIFNAYKLEPENIVTFPFHPYFCVNCIVQFLFSFIRIFTETKLSPSVKPYSLQRLLRRENAETGNASNEQLFCCDTRNKEETFSKKRGCCTGKIHLRSSIQRGNLECR